MRYNSNKRKPAVMQTVMVAGGLGAWDGERWLSMVPGSYERPIVWDVEWWQPLPDDTTLEDAAAKVVKASKAHSGTYIGCLQGQDIQTIQLRLAITALANLIKP